LTAAAGCVAGLASLVVYAAAGYGRGVLVIWLVGLGLLCAAFARSGERVARVSLGDRLAAPIAGRSR